MLFAKKPFYRTTSEHDPNNTRTKHSKYQLNLRILFHCLKQALIKLFVFFVGFNKFIQRVKGAIVICGCYMNRIVFIVVDVIKIINYSILGKVLDRIDGNRSLGVENAA